MKNFRQPVRLPRIFVSGVFIPFSRIAAAGQLSKTVLIAFHAPSECPVPPGKIPEDDPERGMTKTGNRP